MFKFPTTVEEMAEDNNISVTSIYRRCKEFDVSVKDLERSIKVCWAVYITFSNENAMEFVNRYTERELINRWKDTHKGSARQLEFIRDSERIYGDKYSYKKVHYVNRQVKVTITCKQHGDFEQPPASHLLGAEGCKTCQLKKMAAKRRSKNQVPFVKAK